MRERLSDWIYLDIWERDRDRESFVKYKGRLKEVVSFEQNTHDTAKGYPAGKEQGEEIPQTHLTSHLWSPIGFSSSFYCFSACFYKPIYDVTYAFMCFKFNRRESFATDSDCLTRCFHTGAYDTADLTVNEVPVTNSFRKFSIDKIQHIP